MADDEEARQGLKRVAIGLVVLAVIVLVAALFAAVQGQAVTQPIAFNHQVHVEELGSECTDCHLYAETGVRATIPNITVCADCHEEAQTDSPEEARLVEYINRGEPVPWRKVYWVPDHVYFSHRRHTAIGGIECERCHGPMSSLATPVSRPAVDLAMDDCMDCHDQSGTSNDCLLCHV